MAWACFGSLLAVMAALFALLVWSLARAAARADEDWARFSEARRLAEAQETEEGLTPPRT